MARHFDNEYFDMMPDQQRLTEASAELVAVAIDFNLDHAALASARGAARCALLMLASRPGPLVGGQIDTLRDVARLPLRDNGQTRSGRFALARKVLSILEDLRRQNYRPEWRPERSSGSPRPSLLPRRPRQRYAGH